MPRTAPYRPTFSQDPLACSLLNCGEGKCVASNSTLLGVDCQCNPGWKKPTLGNFTVPSCLIPNCIGDLSCSNTQAPPPLFPTPKNCELIWCDMGQCITNGATHICQCVDEANNLFANPEFPCLSQCALGSDCKDLSVGSTPSSSASPGTGSKGGASAAFHSVKHGALATLLLSAIFFA